MRVDVEDGDAAMLRGDGAHDRIGDRMIAAKTDRGEAVRHYGFDTGLDLRACGRRILRHRQIARIGELRQIGAAFSEAVAGRRSQSEANQRRRGGRSAEERRARVVWNPDQLRPVSHWASSCCVKIRRPEVLTRDTVNARVAASASSNPKNCVSGPGGRFGFRSAGVPLKRTSGPKV